MELPSLTPSHEASIKAEEGKRRKREGIVIAVAALMVAALIFFEVQSPDISLENSLGSNIVFFFIININIILLVLLVFLVVRNLLKLVFERRRRLLGSRLQSRLVLAFVALSIVPSLLLFAIAGGLLTHSFDRWFDAKVESALQGSLEIGQTYYQNSANNAMFFARRLSEKITADKLYENARLAELRRLVEEKQREYNLGTVEIYSAESEAIVAVSDKTKRIMDLKPDGEFLARALRGVGVTWTQPLGEGDVIRGGAPIFGPQKRIVGVAVVDYHVPKSLTNRAKQISESYEQYKYLTFLKAPVKNSYILTLFLITLVIMFSATWWGFYLSKGITVPIQKLAEGTHEVAQGNWDYKIETSGDDEIGVLVQSFNQMTGDLKQITLELERRGKVVQTLLANIAAGVVSVDPAGKITTWNKAAEQMLGVKADQVLAKGYRDVLQPEPLRLVAEIIDGVQDREKIEREIKIPQQHEQQLTAVVTAATLRDDDGSALGVMVFLEDITQIQKVQRMEAWREVARRIAHEIKNPLTPIQLSAERLRKRYANLLGGDGGILDKCTTTIIQQVEELKNLVNEFSQFARLPSAKLATHDLNEIVSESLFLFNEGHKGIQFHFRPGVIPTLDLDRDQIKRVLINLLDNAVAAVRDDGEIKLATLYDRGRGVVTLEVADNGSGLAPEMRTKIFEPYFSTKENGTGLGLTIVSQIIEDHRGYIRALPNEPKGTRFSIEFPASEVAKRAAHS